MAVDPAFDEPFRAILCDERFARLDVEGTKFTSLVVTFEESYIFIVCAGFLCQCGCEFSFCQVAK